MMTSAKHVAATALALALISSPGFAKKRYPHISTAPQMTAARAAALRECNAKAEKISFFSRQTEQFFVYRTCMFNHGQME